MSEVVNNLELEALGWIRSAGSMMPAQVAMMESVSIQEARIALESLRDRGLIYSGSDEKYRLKK